MARLPLVVVVLGGLLAACGAASPQGGRSRTGTGISRLTTTTGTGVAPATSSGRKAAAQADAARLVTLLQLPSGDKQVQCPGKPEVIESDLANALAQRCFTVPEGEDAVYAYLKQHLSTDSKIFSTGRGGNLKTGTHNWTVIFSFPKVGNTLSDRLLSVDVSAGSSGTAKVDAHSQSDWIVPRPAAEAIPSGVTEVEVAAGARKITVTGPSKVAAAVKLFNSLEIAQPVTISCPAYPQGKGPKDLIVRFMAGASGPVLARAKVPATAAITPCYPITFTVRGKRMKALIGSHVRGRLRQALGQKLP